MTAQANAVNVTVQGVVSSTACTYRGFWIFSVPGSTVTLYDNASAASGTVLASGVIAANGFLSDDIGDGVRCANGIFLASSAAVSGHVRVG